MSQSSANTIVKPLARIERFEALGFGMFIHWGLYSQMGKGEWIQHIGQVPKDEYQQLKQTFTASRFDADAIARLAKESGMKYIVITTRHHDGFSLYDTCGLNDYDAPHSPAGRDLIREFVDACNEHGILPFFYHTTLDWYRPEFNDDFESYLTYLNASVELLCANYGKIGGLWFDGNWSKPDEDWNEDRLYATIRKHQPDAIIVNNTGLSARGESGHPEIDSVTFEQGHPHRIDQSGRDKYIAAEMCYTINSHWGFGRNDLNNKSTADLIKTLAKCRKVGANLLLNVGPAAEGEILPIQQATLQTIGSWIDLFGDAVYKAKPFDAYGTNDDFVLRTEDKLYFFISDLSVRGHENVTTSSGQLGIRAFVGIHDTITDLKWMDNDEELNYISDPESGMFSFYANGYPYGVDTVVRVAVASLKK